MESADTRRAKDGDLNALTAATTSLTAHIAPLEDPARLEQRWSALAHALRNEVRAPFFLSWDWISVAIATAQNPLYVAEIVSRDGALRGLGLFCEVSELRHAVMRVKQLRLNETGRDARALVPVEYNSLLIARADERAGWRAVLAAPPAQAAGWEEIVVTNAPFDLEDDLAGDDLVIHRRAEHPSAFVDLAAQRKTGATTADYIDTLGRSTRSQLRRAMRLYSERGPLALERAETPGDAHQFFEALCDLHEAKWRARDGDGRQSAGLRTQRHYYDFHRMLIDRCFAAGGVELLRARAGDQPIGYLYNFVEERAVRFNAGGFVIEDDNRLKPGLVTHALAIGDHLSGARDTYDFMAGGDRYKFNLGVPGPAFSSFAIQRRTPALRLEAAARRIKRLTQARRGPENKIAVRRRAHA
ncbi:MAG: GNAT family N-acetyltransferase [Pseudomonadota bacterium]